MQICKSFTRTGAACRAPAGPGGLCFFHGNPDSAKKLGRIGGRKNRRSAIDLEVPENITASGLSKLTGQAMRLLLLGELGPREASAFAQLSNSLSRVIPTAELESRVTMLEQQVAREGRAAQEEGEIAQESASTRSTTDATGVAETFLDVGGEQIACSNDATAEPEVTEVDKRHCEPDEP
jgi:hypothetical protein